jgi:GTPase Era involved in 16S rRNA processing
MRACLKPLGGMSAFVKAGQKVLLKLWVKIKKNWSKDEKFLKELGF